MSHQRTASELIAEARMQLVGTRPERLGDLAASRRLLGFGRSPRIVPVGEAWHLGALLIGADFLAATGEVLRARGEAIRGYTALAQRERSEQAAAAVRGGFADGEVFHLGWRPIDLALVDAGGASGPLSMVGPVPHIRWSPRAPTRPLVDYLAEQVALRPEA